MARGNTRDRSKRAPKDVGRRGKKKVCIFCRDHIDWVDYKDVNLLRKFMSDRGKIRARRVSGNCAQHQREVAIAIKTARELALLPYTQRTMSERAGARIGGRAIAGLPRPSPGQAAATEPEAGAEGGVDLEESALEPEPGVEADQGLDAEGSAGVGAESPAADEEPPEPVEEPAT